MFRIFSKRDKLVAQLESYGLAHSERWNTAEVFLLPGNKRLAVFNHHRNCDGQPDDLSEVLATLCVYIHAKLFDIYPDFSEISSFLAYGKGIDEYLPKIARNNPSIQKISVVIDGHPVDVSNVHIITVQKTVSKEDIRLSENGDRKSYFSMSGINNTEIRKCAFQIFKNVRAGNIPLGIVASQIKLFFEMISDGSLRLRPDFITGDLYFQHDIQDWFLRMGNDPSLRYKEILPDALSSQSRRTELLDALIGMDLRDYQKNCMGIKNCV